MMSESIREVAERVTRRLVDEGFIGMIVSPKEAASIIADELSRTRPSVDEMAREIAEEVLSHDNDDYRTCGVYYCAVCGGYGSCGKSHERVPKPCDCRVMAEDKNAIAAILRKHIEPSTERGNDE
jgi:hypothetical protein